MSKKSIIEELTNLLSVSLRHKIGSIVNKNEIYAQKYARDYEVLLKEAQKLTLEINFNQYDKINIKSKLKIKLKKELEEKEFIDNSKFDIMDLEIDKPLKELGLS